MAESQDVNTLRRRGRRRLVGAIALVLLAAIILPMVFDPEPKPSAPPVSVRIPGEDDVNFAPKVTPGLPPPSTAVPAARSPEPPQQALQPAERPGVIAPPAGRKADDKPVAAATPPAAAAPVAKPAAAPAAKSIGQPGAAQAAPSPVAVEQFVVPVAALASQAKVKELLGKLKSARLPHYTEPVATAKGVVTRIRVGPYATRDAADEAQRQLTRLGLKPGKVLAKS